MARRMHVSRIQLDRLLDPEYDTLPQETVQRAESAIGHSVLDAIPSRAITCKEPGNVLAKISRYRSDRYYPKEFSAKADCADGGVTIGPW